MESVCFDSSVLVPVVIDQLPNHEASTARFIQERDRGATLCCSTHTLAECYAVMTAMPLRRRISSQEAAKLIEVNFIQNLTLLESRIEDVAKAIRLCGDLHRISGQIYDALHLVAAIQKKCEVLYTYNVDHFRPLATDKIRISLP